MFWKELRRTPCRSRILQNGRMPDGAISGPPFELGTARVSGGVMCLLAKMLLVAVFVPIYVLLSVMDKQKLWLSLVGSPCAGMLLFMMIPMLTPPAA